jgi:hypothetical protein
MNEQDHSHTHEEMDGEVEFRMPDCCGPEMARKMETCGPGSSGKREPDGESKETRWTYRSDYDDIEFLSRRGLAQLATGPLADSILLRLRDLSARYGAELTIADSRARLEIASGN